jgi:hypothetical protein
MDRPNPKKDNSELKGVKEEEEGKLKEKKGKKEGVCSMTSERFRSAL